MKIIVPFSLILFMPLVIAGQTAPDLSASPKLAEAGFYQLRWKWPGPPPQGGFILQEATDKTFSRPIVRYRGSDAAAVMSGRQNGIYYYRVRAITATGRSPWSDVVTVTVEHHSLMRALGFFTAGAIVFLATLALVISGARNTRGKG